jgi:DNA modification methylase
MTVQKWEGPDWRIECGDCLDLLKSLPSGSVDCVVTDPPYGIASVWKGGSGSGWGKAREQTDARNAWDANPPPDEVFDELMRLDCPMIIWGGNYFRRLPVSRGWLVWNKPERNFSLSEAELAWTNIDTVVRVFDHHRSDPDRVHPTQKPLALMRWCLDMAKVPIGETVLDPFMGSGTTGVACIQTGRKFIGFELDAKYCEIAARRIGEVGELFRQPKGEAQ